MLFLATDLLQKNLTEILISKSWRTAYQLMTKNITIKLNSILNNKTLGSSELAKLLNEHFLLIKNKPVQIKESIRLAQKKLRHFEVINSYLTELIKIVSKGNKAELLNFLKDYSVNENMKIERIFDKIYPSMKNITSVITFSRSKTVIDVLKLWHKKNRKLKVFICESRPKYEGRLMALNLARAGIKVELITDAMMGVSVHKANAAIIGADLVLKNGNIINKVGSKALALLCKEYKKPFYAVTTRSKFSNRKSYKVKNENPKEVWNKSVKNFKVSNIYFEEVEKKYITKIFTD